MFALSTLGQALILAGVAAAGAGSVLGFVSGARSSARGLAATKGLALAFAVCMVAANLVMIMALVNHDFSVGYVAEVGTTTTPLHITIVSLWASLSGSILLWAGVLGFYVLLLLLVVGRKHAEYLPWTLGVLLAIGVFFAMMVSS
ncbi:MAG: cytochrome c-type biogenesis protein CcmF, partial [Kiritimatiellia bacterium]